MLKKSTHLNEPEVRKPLVDFISQKSEELRLQQGLEYDNLKPPLSSGIFKCMFGLHG
jgi:hypothetical protein